MLRWLLIGLAIISAIVAAAKLSTYRVLHAVADQDAAALASFSPLTRLLFGLMGSVEWAQAITLTVAVPLFAMWVHRMQVNTFALGILDLRYTPAWAVGWYFVPVANLWVPYWVMQEIWCANRNPAGWQYDSAPRGLIFWWLLWLGPILYIRVSIDEDPFVKYLYDARAASVRAALLAVSAIASLMLVTLLHQLQERAASQRLAHVFE